MTDPLDDLTAVLNAENAALAAFDLDQAGAFLARKQDAIARFDAWRKTNTPSPARADALVRLVRTNRRLLDHAMTAQKEVLAILARAARSNGPTGAAAYSAPGRADRPHRGAKLRDAAFALHASA